MTASKRRLKFTQKALAALKPEAKPVLYYDAACPGLGVRISPKGKLSFIWQDGSRRKTLKTTLLETARRTVRELQSQRQASTDADEWTLQHVFDVWLEHKAKPHKRTWTRDVSRFESHLAKLHKRKLATITRLEVSKLHNSIRETSGPYAANDTLAFLSSLYRYAEKHDYSGRNPCKHIDRFPEQERERYLLPEEFPRWFEAVQSLHVTEARDFFMLALWTGIRRECVLAMRWDELDLSSKVWRIPNESDKGKRDILVYLSDEACAILERRLSHATTDWVLPSRNGSASGHYSDPKAAWKSVLTRSGLKDLRIHDLRRTLGSWMAEGGTSLHIIGKTLGHKSQQATAIYARLGGNAVRNAVNAAAKAMKDTLSE